MSSYREKDSETEKEPKVNTHMQQNSLSKFQPFWLPLAYSGN